MYLWLLEKKEKLPYEINELWHFDVAYSFVVRAHSSDTARRIANNDAGNENDFGHNVWLNEEYTTCTKLKYEGNEGQIIRHFRYA